MSALGFCEQLGRQLRFLATSCEQFDAGNADEAIRMATALRVIFHNTGASTSLLRHLGATHIRVLSTPGKRVTNNPNGFWIGAVRIEIHIESITVTTHPLLGSRTSVHRFVPFSHWWESDLIFYGAGHKLFRKNLILAAANKDGGAHVDPSLPAEYRWMAEGCGFSFGVKRTDGSETTRFAEDPHLSCLRQIAYEVLNSPELVELASPRG